MVQNLKELRALLKLCREQGVTEIDLGSVKLKLGALPYEAPKDVVNLSDDVTKDKYANFPEGMLSNEQLAYYSAGGLPDEEQQ